MVSVEEHLSATVDMANIARNDGRAISQSTHSNGTEKSDSASVLSEENLTGQFETQKGHQQNLKQRRL
jgi:hypothetical protein